MNIVYLTNQYSPNVWGGLGVFVSFLAERLRAKNQIWIYTNNPGNLDMHEKNGNLIVHRPVRAFLRRLLRLNRSKGHYTFFSKLVKGLDLLCNNLDCFWMMRENLEKDRYGVIVVHDFMHGLAALLCNYFLKLPIVFHVHFLYSCPRKRSIKDPFQIIRILESALSRKAQSIIVATKEMKEVMVAHGWPVEKIQVVPLCNVNETRPDLVASSSDISHRVEKLRTALSIKKEEKVIVYAGRLMHQKGIFSLIEAMPLILQRMQNVKLILVGEGHRQDLEKRIARLGLQDNVYCYHKFLNQEEVLCHYQLADLCIFPSFQEPFGLVALEAMELGKPVVLGTGFSSVFEGPKSAPNAIYVDPRYPEDLANKAIGLLSNPELATEMGDRARKYVKENFSKQKVLELTMDVYRRAAGRSGRPI